MADETHHYGDGHDHGPEPISFYNVKRGDVLLVATLAVSDAPTPEDGMVGVLRVSDDSTTRLWRTGHIDLPEGAPQ